MKNSFIYPLLRFRSLFLPYIPGASDGGNHMLYSLFPIVGYTSLGVLGAALLFRYLFWLIPLCNPFATSIRRWAFGVHINFPILWLKEDIGEDEDVNGGGRRTVLYHFFSTIPVLRCLRSMRHKICGSSCCCCYCSFLTWLSDIVNTS
jgi:hypothetical protein